MLLLHKQNFYSDQRYWKRFF